MGAQAADSCFVLSLRWVLARCFSERASDWSVWGRLSPESSMYFESLGCPLPQFSVRPLRVSRYQHYCVLTSWLVCADCVVYSRYSDFVAGCFCEPWSSRWRQARVAGGIALEDFAPSLVGLNEFRSSRDVGLCTLVLDWTGITVLGSSWTGEGAGLREQLHVGLTLESESGWGREKNLPEERH
jgi:hypothetical protein